MGTQQPRFGRLRSTSPVARDKQRHVVATERPGLRLELVAHRGAGPEEQRADGGLREREALGDLAQRPALERPHHERVALTRRQMS